MKSGASFSRRRRRASSSPTKKLLKDGDGAFKRVAGEYGYGRVDDLLAAIGYGKLVPRNVIAKYLGPEKFAELDTQKESKLRSGMRAVQAGSSASATTPSSCAAWTI